MEQRSPYSERKLAVVTGASSGIGYELAKVFAKNDFDLIVVAEDSAIHTSADAFREYGGMVHAAQIDLAKFDGVEELYSRIKELGRPLDSIAMNAGVGVSGNFIDTNLTRELNMLHLNIMSVVHLMKRVLPDMVRVGSGRILISSSIAATMPGPYYACYAASKSFIQSFAEAIRKEVENTGVTITALQPGPTDTKFFERADMLDTAVAVGHKDDPAEVAEQGYEAMMAGRDHVVAGSLKNNMQAVVAKFVSEKQAATIHAQQTKPGSAHKQ